MNLWRRVAQFYSSLPFYSILFVFALAEQAAAQLLVPVAAVDRKRREGLGWPGRHPPTGCGRACARRPSHPIRAAHPEHDPLAYGREGDCDLRQEGSERPAFRWQPEASNGSPNLGRASGGSNLARPTSCITYGSDPPGSDTPTKPANLG